MIKRADTPSSPPEVAPALGLSRRAKMVLFGITAIAVLVFIVTDRALMRQFSQEAEFRADLRAQGYAAALENRVTRAFVSAELVSADPLVAQALVDGNRTLAENRLGTIANAGQFWGSYLADIDGTVLAQTGKVPQRTTLENVSAFFVALLDEEGGLFTREINGQAAEFFVARAVSGEDLAVGVVMVVPDLADSVASFAGAGDAVAIVTRNGLLAVATEPDWVGKTENIALGSRSADSAIRRAQRVAQGLKLDANEPFVRGREVIRSERVIEGTELSVLAYTTYDGVRQRVNGFLAIEAMVFALILAAVFYILSRRANVTASVFRRESEVLLELNERLQGEIVARQTVEENLEVAEQTIQQASKLAALGEMSAAVSHELNQPLAAMRTYLAGAKTLLKSRRFEEAQGSFDRIDDMIARMGSITNQLKTQARKGSETLKTVDVLESLENAIEIMGPNFAEANLDIIRVFPRQKVWSRLDSSRFEQVLINLFRNAIDATKNIETPQIEVIVAQSDEIKVSIKDNGPGLSNLEEIFTPFFTTKEAGEGVGLGLSISSEIVAEFDGRLTAYNNKSGGAVFEITLPRVSVEPGET